MNLSKNNLMIRNALPSDAELLCAWWNDGVIMAHAGFPNGLGDTPERIRESLSGDSDTTHRRHIIELDGKPIGEMNYRNKGEQTAEIGIKICDAAEREKGYGTTLLSLFMEELFLRYDYEKIILDTHVKNARAQHVYEHKLGFRRLGVRENSWRDQLGEWQSSIDYELTKSDWLGKTSGLVPFDKDNAEQTEMFLRLLTDYFSVLTYNDPKDRTLPRHIPQILDAILKGFSSQNFWVYFYRYGSNMVGFIIAQIDSPDKDWCKRPGSGCIREIYIAPEHRRKGFARELVVAAEKDISQNGAAQVYVTTDEAADFWESLGYWFSGEHCAVNGGEIYIKDV